MVAGACGPSSPGPRAAAPRPDTAPLAQRASAVRGHWRWTHVSERDGVRRVEVERWHLEVPGPAREPIPVAGSYERVVTFLSLDGVPFTCNQTLSYELRATYRIEGELSSGGLALREVAYQAAPSPCEPRRRALGTYQGERAGDALVLRWPGGEQTLERVPAPEPTEGASPPGPAGLAGAWHWQTRTRRSNEVRVEVERWQLDGAPGGRLRGTIERTVTVFDAEGAYYECSGETYYRYRDRYTVRGHREGARLHISEIAVEPDAHPCLVHQQRHLDSAVGELVGDYLVWTWRGGRRQVLHRPE